MAKEDAYKAAMKNLDALLKKQEALKKSSEGLKDSWSSISSELFKIDGASFFKEVRKSPAELRKIAEEIQNIKDEFDALGDEFTDVIKNASPEISSMAEMIQKELGGAFGETSQKIKQSLAKTFDSLSPKLQNVIKSQEDLESFLNGTLKISEELTKELKSQDEFKKLEADYSKEFKENQKLVLERMGKITSSYKELNNLSESDLVGLAEKIVKGKDWNDIVKSGTKEQREVLAIMSGQKQKLSDINNLMSKSLETENALKKSATETNKEFSLLKGFSEGITKQLKTGWITALNNFDDQIHKTQRETGILMDSFDNSQAMSRLTTSVAQFGVSAEKAAQTMGDMSKELNTTNFSVLATAAKDFAAIEGATGAAAGDITNIAGELMRMGESSGQVKDFMEGADQEARKFGVSSSKILGGISKNIKKMREMGFVGGEKSLTKMALTAERLKMNMDETFDMAKRARSIEGAMDMAAELQLAGGSFSNINPMDLLAAARKGPEELQKILTKMGSDIGHFDKETGKMVFDPVDVDRLQMVADATGQSMESLQNMISTNAQDMQKLSPFQGLIDGMEEADKEMAKSGLSQMLKIGKDGKIELDASSDMAKRMGIDSLEELQSMSSDELKKKMESDKLSIEEQNKRNQSLKNSFDNFLNAFMGIFTILQPVLEKLTSALQFVTEAFSAIWEFFGELGWFGTILQWAIPSLLIFGSSFGLSVKSFIAKGVGGLGGILSKVKDKALGMLGMGGAGAVGGGGEGGAGDVGAKKGMDMAKTWDGIKNSISNIATGIKDSIGGIFNFIKDIAGQILGFVGDIIQQVLDLATRIVDGLTTVLESASKTIGVVQKIVSQLVSIVTKSFVSLMSALGQGITAFATGAATGLGILTPFIPIIIVLTGAIIGLAFAFKLFAEGLGALAPLITSVFNGIATVVLAVGTAVSMVISTIADSILKLSTIDAANLFALAAGLGVLSVAMLAFGAAAAVGGVMSFFGGGMFSQLSELALIAPAIQLLANSLNSAGDGLAKLSAAADSLSIEKLEKLKELSDAMANASSGGNAMAAMANVANATGAAGGGGAGEVRRIEVDVKLNGRELQNFIVKDTAIIK